MDRLSIFALGIAFDGTGGLGDGRMSEESGGAKRVRAEADTVPVLCCQVIFELLHPPGQALNERRENPSELSGIVNIVRGRELS